MSKILIDRAVVDQALEALEHHVEQTRPIYKTTMAIEALIAALEQPQVEQEPVAWAEEIIEYLHAHYDTEMIKELDSGDALIRLDDAIAAVEEVAQRHAHPQPPRQPLTEEEIEALSNDFEEGYVFLYRSFARAIEHAHGITGDQE